MAIIGSLPHEGEEKTFGGTTILMQSLVKYLNIHTIPFTLIQSNRYLGSVAGLKNFFNVFRVLWSAPKQEFDLVMLNSSRNGATFLGPVVFIICKYKGWKFVFRMFGGNFDQFYIKQHSIKRIILRNSVLKSDLMYFETKHLLKYFKTISNTEIKWLPNVRRKREDLQSGKQIFRKRFVFISQVIESKGVDVILEAASSLSQDYKVDIYGPLNDRKYIDFDFNSYNVDYKGVIEPEKVCETLLNYDVLLLPTYYEGEGYPGTIIEAYSVGMPVITTKWKAIPEIVNQENGILIDIQNSSQLVKAIKFFNEKNINSYRTGALKTFNDFNEETVYNKMYNDFNILCNK